MAPGDEAVQHMPVQLRATHLLDEDWEPTRRIPQRIDAKFADDDHKVLEREVTHRLSPEILDPGDHNHDRAAGGNSQPNAASRRLKF